MLATVLTCSRVCSLPTAQYDRPLGQLVLYVDGEQVAAKAVSPVDLQIQPVNFRSVLRVLWPVWLRCRCPAASWLTRSARPFAAWEPRAPTRTSTGSLTTWCVFSGLYRSPRCADNPSFQLLGRLCLTLRCP